MRTPLTAEQQLQRHCERTYDALIDHLAAARVSHGMTYDNVAECLNVSRSTVAKIFHQQPVTISTDTFCRMLEFAGLELKPKGGERNGV
jgi:transcriptional regulator with XRE-family HTH domain